MDSHGVISSPMTADVKKRIAFREHGLRGVPARIRVVRVELNTEGDLSPSLHSAEENV